MLSIKENETERLRLCAVTRECRPVGELVRFVRSPEGEIVPDLKGKLPGRGVWITAAFDIMSEAVKKDVFSKALKSKSIVDENLSDKVGSLLTSDALQVLSLANKAGQVIAGFTKVEKALEKQEVAVLIHASDAASDGMRKLGQVLNRVKKGAERSVQLVEIFESDELSLALGRSNVVHAGLMTNGVCEKFMAAVNILENYRTGIKAYSAVEAAKNR